MLMLSGLGDAYSDCIGRNAAAAASPETSAYVASFCASSTGTPVDETAIAIDPTQPQISIVPPGSAGSIVQPPLTKPPAAASGISTTTWAIGGVAIGAAALLYFLTSK